VGEGDRIAIFLPSLEGGGAERVYVNLANQLAACGRSVDLTLAKACGPYLALVNPQVRIVDLAVRAKPAVVPVLARYLRRERPSVLLSAMDVYNVAALIARRLALVSLPVVVTCHIPISGRARLGERIQDRLLPALARITYASAADIIAVSRGVADDLAESSGIPRDRITVIHNPVATEDIELRGNEQIDHEWLRSDAPPVLVSIGRLAPQKDYGTLLRAFAQLQRPARLIILGEGPERPMLESLARELGIADHIALPGFVENPFAYLAKARLFVLSSAREGFGLVLVEALACGCPVVSTDCRSGPAEILKNGRYGRLVPVGDPGAMAAAIDHALSTSCHPARLKRRAADFAVERIACKYLKILDRCIAQKHRSLGQYQG
jgi:glycosyltransferase involved in cell wall biosynthesis